MFVYAVNYSYLLKKRKKSELDKVGISWSDLRKNAIGQENCSQCICNYTFRWVQGGILTPQANRP